MSIESRVGSKRTGRGPSHRLESMTLEHAKKIVRGFHNRTAYMIRQSEHGGHRYYIFGVTGMSYTFVVPDGIYEAIGSPHPFHSIDVSLILRKYRTYHKGR